MIFCERFCEDGRGLDMNFHFSKGYIVSLLFFLVGSYFVFVGTHAYFRKSAAIPIEELSPKNCEAGAYVYGDIETYAVESFETPNGIKYTGLDNAFVSFLGEDMDQYTIPIAADHYIRFLAVSKDTREALSSYIYLQQHPCYVEGRVVRTGSELNDVFYRQCEEFKDTDYHDVIIPELVIQEISFDRRIGKWKTGVPFLALSLMFFVFSGGRKELVQVQPIIENEEETSKKIRYSHLTRFALEEEQRRLSMLYSKLKQLKKGCLYRLPLLLAGALLTFVSHPYWDLRLLGIIFLVSSLRAILRYFLNSNIGPALSIAKVLHCDSVWIQIMESSMRVQVLQRLMEENETKEE